MKYREPEESALKLNEFYEALEMKLYGRVWTTEDLALGFVGDIGDLANWFRRMQVSARLLTSNPS